MSLARTRLAFAIFLFAASSVSAAISEIQINQAIGVQKDGARKFVAGKDTVVRAFLTEPTAINHATTSARITRDGTTVTTLSPAGTDGASTQVVDFLCPSRTECGEWAAGAYTFDVRVNGEFQSTSGVDYHFLKRAPLRVLALPVLANYGGTIVPVTDERWKTFGDYVRKTYPLAPEDFVWEIRDALDASDASFDLETDDGQRNLWEALAKLIPAHCADNPAIDGCFHQVFGFIMDRPKGYPNGTLQGYTFGKPANVGVVRDEDAPATVAHEIGHTFGLGDTYDGGSFNCPVNPAPDEFTGKDFDTSEEGKKCSSGRKALEGVGGTLIPASHHPYEVGGRGALSASAEYMGSGGLQAQFWTTQDAWDHLFDKFAPEPVKTASSVRVRATARFIQCFGTMTTIPAAAADAQVDPCWTYDDEEGSIPNTTGKYMMASVDAAGMRLSSAALNLDFTPVAPKGTAPTVYPIAPFGEEMRLPAAAVKLQFLFDGRVIREIAISKNAPTVTAVAPELQGTVATKKTISWQASDTDGDALSFEVLYNPDTTNSDSEWEILVRDVKGRSLPIDFAELPGGPNAQIAVVATDGVNVGEGVSGRFVVAPKPPDVFIGAEKTFVIAGTELVLDSEVLDLQDDWIEEESLVWSSSIAGTIGTGPTLVTDRLALGKHVITLTATNSAGLKGTDQITVDVVTTVRRRSVRR